MNDISRIINNDQKSLKLFLSNEIIKKAKKLRGKLASFSEIIDDKPRVLKIMKAYDLGNFLKNCYLFIVKNYSNQPKERYYIATRLASQSSDLLVKLANDFAQKNSLKLIQYAIDPKLSRISLISLKEIKKIDDYSHSVNVLTEFRKNFLDNLIKIKNLVK
ncbi:MAG: hypothetical protein EU532_01700 [Promethearchaeota archaeon]|nr:MAG: hypothetical protein EU532_01700 [Candidatus Lokiarchaeota archaeon]